MIPAVALEVTDPSTEQTHCCLTSLTEQEISLRLSRKYKSPEIHSYLPSLLCNGLQGSGCLRYLLMLKWSSIKGLNMLIAVYFGY